MLNYDLNSIASVDFEKEKNNIDLLAFENDGNPAIVKGSTVKEPSIDYQSERFKNEVDYRIAASSYMPIGSIIMWLNKNTVPAGWHLCDGSIINDLEISEQEKEELIDIMGGENLPKMNYSKDECDGIDNIAIGLMNDDIGSHLSNIKTDKDGIISRSSTEIKLTWDNIPFHSHSFTDYYFAESEGGGGGVINPGNQMMYYKILPLSSPTSISSSFNFEDSFFVNNRTDSLNSNSKGKMLGSRSTHQQNNVMLWARNRTSGMVNPYTERLSDGKEHEVNESNTTRDGFYCWNLAKPIYENTRSKTKADWNKIQKPLNAEGFDPPTFNLYYIIKIEY